MPGAVPYTSTLALTNVTLPYIKLLVSEGEESLKKPFFKGGVNIYKGNITHEGVSEAFNLPFNPVF